MSVVRRLTVFADNKPNFKICNLCDAHAPLKRRRCKNCGEKPVWRKPNAQEITKQKQHNAELERTIYKLTSAAIKANTPIGQFLSHFNAIKLDSAKPVFGISCDYELASVAVGFNLRPLNDNTIVLQSLKAANPRSGEGSQALTIICRVADRCKVIILLDAAPYDTQMSRNQLINWYKKFGFVTTEHSEMRRNPK